MKEGRNNGANGVSVLPFPAHSDTAMVPFYRRSMPVRVAQGGYVVVPVYCFGVSLTHDLLPGVDNRLTRYLSRKVQCSTV